MLEQIKTPKDITELNYNEKEQLAKEIRERLIDVVLKNGGHLASNLGIVELTIGLYSILDPFYDRIIWDVGHQAYVHKILTGRNENFETLRQYGGMSGFPKREESKADCFETGHSSTSVSAAVGMARARDMSNEKYRVVAIIGDGAFTNGMVYEALNDAGTMKNSVIFILNDNGMSIAKNVGGMSKYLRRIRTGKSYLKAKKRIKSGLGRIPFIGEHFVRLIQRFKVAFRKLTIPGEWFEEMGIKYIGPIDGHNIKQVEEAVNRAIELDCPVLIHAITKKGKGYEEAENNPSAYHGVAPKEKNKSKKYPAYSTVMANKLVEMADDNDKIAAITAAMPSGTGLEKFEEKHPERFVDVGIAEEHAVTMAAGMAAVGMKPYVAIYSTFMQRAYDQLLHDCALQKLNVTITLDRAGISGRDGRTHHGIYDISFLNSVPGVIVCAPCCSLELQQMLEISGKDDHQGPYIIRYPAKDTFDMDMTEIINNPVELGKGAVIYSNSNDENKINILFITFGQITQNCIQAAMAVKDLCNVTVFNGRYLKPLDENGILYCINNFKPAIIFTAEDGVGEGGFGSSIALLLQRIKYNCCFENIAVPQNPIEHGDINELFSDAQMDSVGIVKRVMRAIEQLNLGDTE